MISTRIGERWIEVPHSNITSDTCLPLPPSHFIAFAYTETGPVVSSNQPSTSHLLLRDIKVLYASTPNEIKLNGIKICKISKATFDSSFEMEKTDNNNVLFSYDPHEFIPRVLQAIDGKNIFLHFVHPTTPIVSIMGLSD